MQRTLLGRPFEFLNGRHVEHEASDGCSEPPCAIRPLFSTDGCDSGAATRDDPTAPQSLMFGGRL